LEAALKPSLDNDNSLNKVSLFDHKWPYIHTRAKYRQPSWNLAGWLLMSGTSQVTEARNCLSFIHNCHVWMKHCSHSISHLIRSLSRLL